MRVAVTGADGFTGRFVAEALRSAGAEPIALRVDLTDADAVAHTVDATAFDRVIHLAGVAFAGGTDWRAFYAVNQIGSLNLLEAIARKAPGTRCVLASSAQVYGPGAQGLIAETAPTNPANHYAVSKRAMELGASVWHDRLDVVLARPFNYTGEGQDAQYLVPKIVDHFRRKAPVVELGNTWVKRDFGDVRSVAEAYVGLVLAQEVPPVVNIATGVVLSIADIIDRLARISGHRIEVQVNQAFVRPDDVPILGGDISVLAATLPDWRSHDIGETLDWMYGAVHEDQ